MAVDRRRLSACPPRHTFVHAEHRVQRKLGGRRFTPTRTGTRRLLRQDAAECRLAVAADGRTYHLYERIFAGVEIWAAHTKTTTSWPILHTDSWLKLSEASGRKVLSSASTQTAICISRRRLITTMWRTALARQRPALRRVQCPFLVVSISRRLAVYGRSSG